MQKMKLPRWVLVTSDIFPRNHPGHFSFFIIYKKLKLLK